MQRKQKYQQSWNLLFGNKGIVFSLDAVIAITIVLILLVYSSYYLSTSSKESVSQLQITRVGTDAIAMMDLDGLLDLAVTNYPELGSGRLDDVILNYSKYLPPSYDMKIYITDTMESITNKTENDKIKNGLGPEGYAACPQNLVNSNDLVNYYCVVNSSSTPPGGGDPIGGWVMFDTRYIERAGEYFVQVNVSVNNADPLSRLWVTLHDNNTPQIIINYTVLNLGLYYNATNATFVTNFTMKFNQGVHRINFTADLDGRYTIFWYRVMGTEAYMGSTSKTAPTDRFVGAGNRYFVNTFKPPLKSGETKKIDNILDIHGVRHLIWIK